MGQFKQDFKNYESYQDDEFYKKTVPDGLPAALAQIFTNTCEVNGDQEVIRRLISVANDLSVALGERHTTNWDIGALRSEIKSSCCILCEKKFDRFMDGVRKASESLCKTISNSSKGHFLDNINTLFDDTNFGYILRQNDNDPGKLIWEARWKAAAGVSALESASSTLTTLPEALEHIQQAKDHLLRPDEPRSRKDSVRDAMSAMEAMLKRLANKDDIKKAIRQLKEEGCWGLHVIVKDGLTIWDHLHRFYPDLRHGQQNSSEIDLDEALYWLSRMSTYINYMADKAKSIGR